LKLPEEQNVKDWKFPEVACEIVVEASGKTAKRVGRVPASDVSSVEIPAVFSTIEDPEVRELFDADGKPKGDKPLGMAFDADGFIVPDWEIVSHRLTL